MSPRPDELACKNGKTFLQILLRGSYLCIVPPCFHRKAHGANGNHRNHPQLRALFGLRPELT